MKTDHEAVQVEMSFQVDDEPLMVYVWSHVGAGWLVEALRRQGITATVTTIKINGTTGVPL